MPVQSFRQISCNPHAHWLFMVNRMVASMPVPMLVLLLLPGLIGCSSELSLEQQITAKLRNMEAHIEAGERRDFMSYVSKDFQGQGGEFNYDQLNGLMLVQLRRHKRVHVQILATQIQPAGTDEAAASFQVLLTGGEGWLPDTGQLYQVHSIWQQQDGDWLLQSAHWQAAGVGSN